MKKIKILSSIFIILSILLAAYAIPQLNLAETSPTYNVNKQYLLYSLLFILFSLILFILLIIKKDKLIAFPLLGFIATGLYYVRKIYETGNYNNTILDVISPNETFTVLTFLLFVGFIVCLFVGTYKNNKYTKMYVAAYFALLVFTTFKFLPEIAMDKDMQPFATLTYSMISGYIAAIILFIPVEKKQNMETNEASSSKEENKE